MNHNLIKTFAVISKVRNTRKAAEIIGLTPSAINKQLLALETLLDVKLFHGFPTGIQLTGEGEEFAKDAERLCEALEQAIARVQSAKDTAAGPLKLIVAGFGATWFPQHSVEFLKCFPEVELTIVSDEYKTLLYASATSGVFAGLTSFEPPEKSSFRWEKIGSYKWYPFAHPNYIKAYGTPTSIADLDRHHLIKYSWAHEFSYIADRQSNLLLYLGRDDSSPRKPVITVDDSAMCKQLVEEGVGIGLLPRFLVKKLLYKKSTSLFTQRTKAESKTPILFIRPT